MEWRRYNEIYGPYSRQVRVMRWYTCVALHDGKGGWRGAVDSQFNGGKSANEGLKKVTGCPVNMSKKVHAYNKAYEAA